MKKRNLLVAMIAGLALIVAPIVGCGPEDPAGNQNQNDGNGDNDNDGNDDECSTSSDCNDDQVCEGNQCVDDSGDETCSSSDDCEGNEICNEDEEVCELECTFSSDCDDDTLVCEENRCVEEQIEYDCEVADWFYGQMGAESESDVGGGTPTTQALTESSGLQEVVDAIELELEDYTDEEISDETIDVDLSAEPISIEGATVTAINFKTAHEFWLQDADTGIYFFRFESNDEAGVPEQPSVGDKVSFDVEMAGTFGGTPQIRDFSNWEITEEGTDVPYTEIEDQEITNDEHYNEVVRVVMKLTNDSWECGYDQCFTALYGADGQHEIVYKSGSDFDEAGSCVTYAGPVSSFPGYYTEDSAVQIAASNWDWTYTAESGGLD